MRKALDTVPLVLVGLHLASALASYLTGARSDRVGRRPVLVAGTLVLILLIVAHLVLAKGRSPAPLWIGVTLWGLHMGHTQRAATGAEAAAPFPAVKA